MPAPETPWLRLHMEPAEPIEVTDLTGALAALARQYDVFAKKHWAYPPSARVKLLISNISPGSIDINFVPEVAASIATLLPIVHSAHEFAEYLSWLLDFFKVIDGRSPPPEISVQDCDDVVNIVKPIAKHGGNQVFNTFNGSTINIFSPISVTEARTITENAVRTKETLRLENPERRERVSLIWKRLDRDAAKREGSTPDKVIIEEIDPHPRAVHFTDAMAYLKDEMIRDDDNPYRKVYFVDVEVSRVNRKVVAYRIVGYHGKDDLEEEGETDLFL